MPSVNKITAIMRRIAAPSIDIDEIINIAISKPVKKIRKNAIQREEIKVIRGGAKKIKVYKKR